MRPKSIRGIVDKNPPPREEPPLGDLVDENLDTILFVVEDVADDWLIHHQLSGEEPTGGPLSTMVEEVLDGLVEEGLLWVGMARGEELKKLKGLIAFFITDYQRNEKGRMRWE